MPAIAGPRSSRRSRGRRPLSTSRPPSRWGTRRCSRPPRSWSTSPHPASTTSSSPTRARNRSKPRSKWRLPTIAREAMPRKCASSAASAAVIVEPVACSAGVLIPPKGYLTRLADICARHDILLVMDEVITGFGRLGAPFGADYFGISPDIITTAKGITNGVVPMGAVLVTSKIHDAFMTGPDYVIEFFHGYTYSGNPMACAAVIATLETYQEEGLLTRAAELARYWEEAMHALDGLPHVIDIRNIGLTGAIELDPVPGEPTRRAYRRFVDAFERGLLVRATGDTIALSPPLIIEKAQIDELFDILTKVLK